MDLISVLILLYTVSGETYESEHAMSHDRCMVAAEVITKGIADHTAPPVEMLDGTRVPLTGARCITGCVPNAMAHNWALDLPLDTPLRESDQTEG